MIQNNNINAIKSVFCPYCHNENTDGPGQPIIWHTSEEEIIAGNRTIICPDCGMHIIVPFCSPKIDFYEQEIYHGDETSGEIVHH